MLEVNISKRIKKYVSFENDTIPNKGGYFCRIYEDENGDFDTGLSFVVENKYLRGVKDDSERYNRACRIAKDKVLRMF